VKLIIALPVYNEEKSLPLLLARIRESMRDAATPYRVVAVDDGSTDRSLAIVQSFTGCMPLCVLRHATNQGLGCAIRDALLWAAQNCSDNDFVVTLDADNSQPPECIPQMLERLKAGVDVVIASRYAPGARTLNVRCHRRIVSRLGNQAYRIRFPVRGVRDYTCGFRAYRAGILRTGFRVYGENLVRSRGFECMAEILVKLRALGAIFAEVPFTLDYGAKPSPSKMRLCGAILGNLRVLMESEP
jgi:dolichol-phosphate mannosyltransferase